MNWSDFFAEAEKLGIPLTPQQREQFRLYTNLLLERNQQINLTAIREEKTLLAKFHLDGLSLLPIVARYSGISIGNLRSQKWRAADVGSGGGAPAMPLAIGWPALNYALIESIAKKARFLQDVASVLGLNMTVVNQRAEVIGRDPNHRESYDLVTARAVAALPTLAELTMPLARIGGLIVLPKGPKANIEVRDAADAIDLLGGELAGVEQVIIPGLDETRVVVVIRKVRETLQNYPRRPGLPKKKPL